MTDRLHFFEPTAINEAQLQDDAAAARASGGSSEFLADADPNYAANLTLTLPGWFWPVAVAVLALVSFFSWIWPWGFAK